MRTPVAGAIVAMLCGLIASAQEPRDRTMGHATAEGTRLVSSTVMATYHLNGAVGSPNLAVVYVILWRGKPGWMGNGNSKTVSSSGGGTSKRLVGSHALEVTVDGTMTSATVAGTVVDLRKANAIFVDNVDQPSAAKVVDTRFLDVQPPKTVRGPEMTQMLFGALPTLPSFAGCDPAPAGPRDAALCGQLGSRPR